MTLVRMSLLVQVVIAAFANDASKVRNARSVLLDRKARDAVSIFI